MNWARAFAVARKEVFHILRDPFTLALALGMPVILVTIFGLAIEFNVKDVRLTVYDRDHSQASRGLVETFSASDYFHISSRTGNRLDDLDSERAKAVLVIEPGFEADVGAGRQARAQVILDGADNSTVGVILGYLGGIQASATRKIIPEPGAPGSLLSASPVALQTRFFFNPELNSRWFVIPGLTVAVIAILSVLLTSLTVAREWENGSMELLLSTPVQPVELILGKLVPYLGLGLGAVAFIYLVARLGLGVPFRGSHLLFALGSTLFIGTYLAQGLLISVLARKQVVAMQAALISGLLPSLLMSGFIFPIESMPKFFQFLTMILPARWFMIISRSIFLRGAGLVDLAVPFTALVVLNVVLITAASRRFKKDLEP